MTRIIGAPLAPGSPPAKMVIQEESPYQGGSLGLSPGRYEATYDYTAKKWMSSGGELNVLMPRRDHEDPVASGNVTIYVTTNYSSPDLSRTARLTYSPSAWAETSPGVLDLSVNPEPLAWVASATIVELMADTHAAREQAVSAAQATQAAIADAQTAAAATQNAIKTAEDAAVSATLTVDRQLGRIDSAIVSSAERTAAVLGQATQATEQLRALAGVYALGREPKAGDPAGIYRFGVEDISWDGAAVTGRTPALVTAQDTAGAIAASRLTVTPEQFGATGRFDPLQYGTAGWDEHASANNASLAFAKIAQLAQQNPSTTYTVRLAGRYYLGGLSGEVQRAHGRTLYGTAAAPMALGSYAQTFYESMPVCFENIPNIVLDGAGCEIYMGVGQDTGIAAYNTCLTLTGNGTIYGYSPDAPDSNTEQFACVRYLAGSSGGVGPGWTLTAFLGDGVLVGGLRTDQGGTDTAHAARDVSVEARIIERYGNGTRPWNKAGTSEQGDVFGSMSRLCVAVIHAYNVTISSQHLSGGVDTEANVDGQLMVNVQVKNTRFRDRWVLPFGAGNPRLHPWEPEPEVLPGTPGAALLDNSIVYTSPADAPVVSGGGIFDVRMDTGWVYMHNRMIAPVDGLAFDAGLLIFGNQGNDAGKATSGGSIRNVSARTVLRRDLYGLTPNPYENSNALIVLSGNVRASLFENITVQDAAAAAIALSHVANHTAGNTEDGNTYLNCRNVGQQPGGAGRVLAFAPSDGSREAGSQSARRGTARLHTTLPFKELRLDAEGKIDYMTAPAGEYSIYNESLISFFGFKNSSVIPEGTRFIFRASAESGVGFGTSSGLVVASVAPLVLRPGDEIEFAWRAGQLHEVRRQLSPRTTITSLSSDADVATIRDTVNALIREMQRRAELR